jgi:hypothetical protein
MSNDMVQRSRIDPKRLTPNDIMALQSTVGNAYVLEHRM